MRRVPVDSRRADWSRLVAQSLNDTIASASVATGWGGYNDTAGNQSLAATTRTLWTNNAGSKIETQKPADVSAFWASNKITGRKGDAIVVKVQFSFTPDDATASELRLEVDIGGAIGVVEDVAFPLVRGALVEDPITWTFLAYTLDTWEANGGSIYVEADGPGVLTNKRVVIARVHKAR